MVLGIYRIHPYVVTFDTRSDPELLKPTYKYLLPFSQNFINYKYFTLKGLYKALTRLLKILLGVTRKDKFSYFQIN